MAVPYTFANATVSIPLSQLDSNFATAITLGNTAIQLGNTVTTLNNMTLANVTISSGNVTITNVSVTNVNATTVDTTNLEATNIKAKDGTASITLADSTGIATLSANPILNGGTANSVAYLNGSKVLTTGSALTFDGSSMVLNTSTASDALRITQTGAGNALVVEDSANPDSTPFVIDTNGKTIMGTTAVPSGVDASAVFIQTHSTTVSARPLAMYDWRNGAASATGIVFGKSKSGTIGTQGVVASGDLMGGVEFTASDGTNFITASSITSNVDGTPGTNDMPGRLVFSTTADGASSPTERMRIDNAGRVGIGSTALSGYNMRLGKAMSGTSPTGFQIDGALDSTAAGGPAYFAIVPSTAAGGSGVGNLYYSYLGQGSFGTAVTNQFGYYVAANLTGATNNYGFYSNIASGTGRYNFYAAGTADNYFAGSVGIGLSPATGNALRINKNMTGATSAYGIYNDGVAQSDVTSSAIYFESISGTAAAAFTLTEIRHFDAAQGTFGAGSTVTNQFGHVARSTLTGATNNYGYQSGLAAGTGRWNFYAAGTADNYFAGNVGIGSTSLTGYNFRVSSTITGATNAQAVFVNSTVQSDVTGNAWLYRTNLNTAAASFTLTNATHYQASQVTIGAGSAVTNQFGFHVDSSLTGATNNFGFHSNIAAGTGRYNFYAAGTAQNLFSGDVLVFGAGGLGYTTGSGGAVTQATSRTTGVTLNKTNGAITLVSAAGSATYQTFTVTNSTVAATDTIIINQKSGTDKYIILVTNVSAGSFAITFATTGGTTTEQPVFNFAVIKAVTA